MNHPFPNKCVLTDQWGTLTGTERTIKTEKEFSELNGRAVLSNCLFMEINAAKKLDKRRDEAAAK